MKIFSRIYNDYLMPSRLNYYENMLKNFLDNNYEFLCHNEYEKTDKNKYQIFLRHDIDSDIKIAKKMFEIEKKLGIKSTFYFRLSTFDKKLVNNILDYGSEVGYHFEEIANFYKKNKLKNREEVFKHLEKIQANFYQNFYQIEKKYHFKIDSIAAHGDFVNRKIKIENRELLTEKIRKKINLKLEAYDEKINKHIDIKMVDCCYPKFWKDMTPEEAIKLKHRTIMILLHTRWWDKSPFERGKNELLRLKESLSWLINNSI